MSAAPKLATAAHRRRVQWVPLPLGDRHPAAELLALVRADVPVPASPSAVAHRLGCSARTVRRGILAAMDDRLLEEHGGVLVPGAEWSRWWHGRAWAPLPMQMLREGTAATRRAAAALLGEAQRDRRGVPTIDELAARVGGGRHTIYAGLDLLVEAGLAEPVRCHRRGVRLTRFRVTSDLRWSTALAPERAAELGQLAARRSSDASRLRDSRGRFAATGHGQTSTPGRGQTSTPPLQTSKEVQPPQARPRLAAGGEQSSRKGFSGLIAVPEVVGPEAVAAALERVRPEGRVSILEPSRPGRRPPPKRDAPTISAAELRDGLRRSGVLERLVAKVQTTTDPAGTCRELLGLALVFTAGSASRSARKRSELARGLVAYRGPNAPVELLVLILHLAAASPWNIGGALRAKRLPRLISGGLDLALLEDEAPSLDGACARLLAAWERDGRKGAQVRAGVSR